MYDSLLKIEGGEKRLKQESAYTKAEKKDTGGWIEGYLAVGLSQVNVRMYFISPVIMSAKYTPSDNSYMLGPFYEVDQYTVTPLEDGKCLH